MSCGEKCECNKPEVKSWVEQVIVGEQVYESDVKEILIKYFDSTLEKISKIDIGDWIDLRCAIDIELKAGEYKLLPLGVAMKPPAGFESNFVPRSSTFKNWGILQTNHFSVIDESFCGNNDQWHFPVYATRDTTICKGDRICQFRINKKQPPIIFIEVETLEDEDRGGIGSTGV